MKRLCLSDVADAETHAAPVAEPAAIAPLGRERPVRLMTANNSPADESYTVANAGPLDMCRDHPPLSWGPLWGPGMYFWIFNWAFPLYFLGGGQIQTVISTEIQIFF